MMQHFIEQSGAPLLPPLMPLGLPAHVMPMTVCAGQEAGPPQRGHTAGAVLLPHPVPGILLLPAQGRAHLQPARELHQVRELPVVDVWSV